MGTQPGKVAHAIHPHEHDGHSAQQRRPLVQQTNVSVEIAQQGVLAAAAFVL